MLAGRKWRPIEDPDKFGTMLLLVALRGPGCLAFLQVSCIDEGGDFRRRDGCYNKSTGTADSHSGSSGAISGTFSAIIRVRYAPPGIAVAAKHREASMRALVYGALVETYAVLALVISIFLLFS